MERCELQQNELPQDGFSTHLFEVVQHLMICSCREGLWETLLTVLADKSETHVSLWRKQGQSYHQIKPALREPGLAQTTIIESVFNTGSPGFVSRCSVDKTTGLSSELVIQSALALPIFEGDKLTAVLHLERNGAFGETEFQALLSLSNAINGLLGTLPENKRLFVASGGPKL